jgi:hypothetical protein
MPGFKSGKHTGRSHSHGDESIGGLLGRMSALSELPNTPKSMGPKFSHPGPGNGSGTVPPGKPMTAGSNRP